MINRGFVGWLRGGLWGDYWRAVKWFLGIFWSFCDGF